MKIIYYTAAILDSYGWRENGRTTYDRAVEQLRAGEDIVERTGGRARLYGSDKRGRRTLLAEFKASVRGTRKDQAHDERPR